MGFVYEDADGREEQARLTALGKRVDKRYIDAKRICGTTRRTGDERIGRLHRISDLVIRRREDGAFVLAAFINYFTREQIISGQIPRPQEWLELDFVSGELLARHSCKRRDFSSASFDTVYSLLADNEYDLSPEYYRAAYNVLDEVRIGAMKTGELDMERYDEYLDAIMSNTPREYRQFFEHLSDPDGLHQN